LVTKNPEKPNLHQFEKKKTLIGKISMKKKRKKKTWLVQNLDSCSGGP
jgi:hypothetical protein